MGAQFSFSWKAARPFLALAVVWALIHALAVLSGFAPVLDGELKGPDSYMRLVRVDALWSGGGWFDNLIVESNAPLGDTLHWTQPFDILILLGGWALDPFLGHERALFWAGSLTSPIIQLGTLVAMAWAVRPLLGKRRAWLAMAVLFAQPAVMFNSLAGRADHHSLQLFLLVVGIGFLVRALQRPESGGQERAPGNNAALFAGLVALSCDLQSAAAHLNGPVGLRDEPYLILTSIFYGSELLYRTDHQIVTGPYHRNDTAILDTYDALTAVDDGAARTIMERRGGRHRVALSFDQRGGLLRIGRGAGIPARTAVARRCTGLAHTTRGA